MASRCPAAGQRTAVPCSRLNFVTFDRIAQIELADCLQAELSPLAATTNSSPAASTIAVPACPAAAAAAASSAPSLASASLCRLGTVGRFGVHSVAGLLSPAECAALADRTNSQDSLRGEYSPAQRDSTRLLVRAPFLAAALWARVEPAVRELCAVEHPALLRPMGFGAEGKWRPVGLNPVLRFVTYEPGSSGFQPHRDAPFVEHTARRSIYTLLVYLSEPEPFSVESAITGTEVAMGAALYDSLPASGSTEFFESVGFTAGLPMREETLRRVLRVRPAAGMALLFPHHLVHSGAALSFGSAAKRLLRADVLFERVGPAPLLPPAHSLNWRQQPEFLHALELFQRAFKLELAGQLDDANDCYERSASLRAEPIFRAAEMAAATASVQAASALGPLAPTAVADSIASVTSLPSLPSCALRISRDALSVVRSFLDASSARQLAASCRDWRAYCPSLAGPLQQRLAKLTAGPVLHSHAPPAALSDRAAAGQATAAMRLTRRLLPSVCHVSGLGCELRYPRRFFARHRSSCRRVMAVLAAAQLSHHLPPLEPTAESDARDRLLASPFVLSYAREADGAAGRVEWCTLGELLRAVFQLRHVPVRVGTLSEFNEQTATLAAVTVGVVSVKGEPAFAVAAAAASASASASASAPASASPVAGTGAATAWRPYSVGCTELTAANIYICDPRLRHAVSVNNLLPMFFHAGEICCGEWLDTNRHHEGDCEWLETERKNKASRREKDQRHYQRANAEELCTMDEAVPGTANHLQK